MFNLVVLSGRLTADPELKTTSNGVSVCSFSIAVERRYNQGVNAKFDIGIDENGIAHSLIAKGPGAVAVAAVDCRNCTENSDINGTLQSHMSGGSSLNLNNVVRVKYIVRRLTPLECERLQGYPDGWIDIGEWTDSKGKVHKTSDAARYKALGNSIALPPWKWVLKRLCACYERDATLGSLFDGISGFCLIWTQLNGLGSVKFTSEEETGEEGDFYEAILGKNKTENV